MTIYPTKEAVHADAQLQIRKVTSICKGMTLDGVPWSIIVIDGYGEFRCHAICTDFLNQEESDQIAAMMTFIEHHEVKAMIKSVRGW